MKFFNLVRDGDSAVVRILNTDVSKMEIKDIHFVDVGGKKKTLACLGKDNCPLCDNSTPVTRLFVHLWDYTDNEEKVWSRTPNENFLNSLRDVVDSWGNLCDCVIKITRNGDNFPKYSITVLNPNKYPMPDKQFEIAIDGNVAYRCSTYRSSEELAEFVRTGYLPDHVKTQTAWIPKEEWVKRKKEESESKKEENNQQKFSSSTDFDDPFV